LQAEADEDELRAVGGRRAVLESIRRHLPDFDPEGARVPCGPSWLRLKPLLVRSGLSPVDQSTTLTDIKAFLDATPPLTAFTHEESQPMPDPDPQRVFVIYGRNLDAYDQMVKFLRALKLDPVPFNKISAECGANASVREIIRHGMAKAAGVVAMFTPDEYAVLRPEHDSKRGAGEESRRWQARPNVIYEAGLAMGMAEQRTVLVKLGTEVRLFSDVGGIHTVNLDNGFESRNLLRDKLQAAGCTPDMMTDNHLHVGQSGDFAQCVMFPNAKPPTDPFN
jgi:predicted nucleotide-binding protein